MEEEKRKIAKTRKREEESCVKGRSLGSERREKERFLPLSSGGAKKPREVTEGERSEGRKERWFSCDKMMNEEERSLYEIVS